MTLLVVRVRLHTCLGILVGLVFLFLRKNEVCMTTMYKIGKQGKEKYLQAFQ